MQQTTWETEEEVADYIDNHFVGFGPKQARNVLQALRLTRYEISDRQSGYQLAQRHIALSCQTELDRPCRRGILQICRSGDPRAMRGM
jgi:hypothetical protein